MQFLILFLLMRDDTIAIDIYDVAPGDDVSELLTINEPEAYEYNPIPVIDWKLVDEMDAIIQDDNEMVCKQLQATGKDC